MLVVSWGIKINDTMKSIEKDTFRSSQKVGWEGIVREEERKIHSKGTEAEQERWRGMRQGEQVG